MTTGPVDTQQHQPRIDVYGILAERSPGLAKKLPPLVRTLLRLAVHERYLNSFVQRRQHLSAEEFCDQVLDDLDITVRLVGQEHLRAAKRPVICANHPCGGVEGVALIAAASRLRGRCLVPANDLLCMIRPLADIIVPVRHGQLSRTSADAFDKAFRGDDPILVFPAGVTARVYGGVLRESPWRSSFVTRARKYGRELLPVAVDGRNSRLFYGIHKLRRALGVGLNIEMTLLLDEVLRQRGNTITLTVLPPRSAESAGEGRASDMATANAIQMEVEAAARAIAAPTI